MKQILKYLTLLLIITFSSCKRSNDNCLLFKYLDYSECHYYWDSDTTYSLRLDSAGNYIIRYDTIQNKLINKEDWIEETPDYNESKREYYTGKLNIADINRINKEFKKIEKIKIDSLYRSMDIIEVGRFNKIIIRSNLKNIYSESWNDNDALEMKYFKQYIFFIIKNKMTSKKDTIFEFESLKNLKQLAKVKRIYL